MKKIYQQENYHVHGIREVLIHFRFTINIASYALLTHMIAHVCNMSVGDLIFNGGDTHLYLNHLEQAKELISRDVLDSPTLYLNPKVKTIDEFNFEDIKIENYVSQGVLKAPLSTGL